MLLSKALRITDSVEASVTSHLPGPLAMPVHLAVAAVTWVPRQVLGREHEVAEPSEPATASTPTTPAATKQADEAPSEPEVVLTLDRPAEELEPPIDVVGEALRAEASTAPPAHADEEHVEVEETVVFSTSTDDAG